MFRPTIADVAKKAGVSKSTVSHVLNNTRFVAQETREQVMRIIQELDYRPSQIARSLTTKRTNTVGLLITDVGNPFYHRIILGVEDVALAHDYSVFLFNASYDQQRSIKYIRSMIQRQVDGIILMSSRMSRAIVAEPISQNIPTVVLDWREFAVEHAGTIGLNFERGVRQAVTHLRNLGHERFAYVTSEPELWTARIRRDLYVNALAHHGINADRVTVAAGDFTIEGGRRALRTLMQGPTPPTAILAVNDLTALGLMFEARHLGLSVPEDFSVVGVDDIALAAQVTPSLTTIALPGDAIGRLAMSMLLDVMEVTNATELHGETYHHVVETELIIRESTAAPSVGAR